MSKKVFLCLRETITGKLEKKSKRHCFTVSLDSDWSKIEAVFWTSSKNSCSIFAWTCFPSIPFSISADVVDYWKSGVQFKIIASCFCHRTSLETRCRLDRSVKFWTFSVTRLRLRLQFDSLEIVFHLQNCRCRLCCFERCNQLSVLAKTFQKWSYRHEEVIIKRDRFWKWKLMMTETCRNFHHKVIWWTWFSSDKIYHRYSTLKSEWAIVWE